VKSGTPDLSAIRLDFADHKSIARKRGETNLTGFLDATGVKGERAVSCPNEYTQQIPSGWQIWIDSTSSGRGNNTWGFCTLMASGPKRLVADSVSRSGSGLRAAR
jgi:hypothetical protein